MGRTMTIVVVVSALLQTTGAAQEARKDEVSGRLRVGQALDRSQIDAAWNALDILSNSTSPAAKEEMLRQLPARKPLKDALNDKGLLAFPGLRGGLMQVASMIYNPAASQGRMDGKRAKNILSASRYLISELDGGTPALANEWLCLLWGVSLPGDDSPVPLTPASGWEHNVKTGTQIGLVQYLNSPKMK